ncbi:hypothetical protein BDV38DRAFT_262515 [Aspergillus pseudotamarii]|uniref:Uncharacterized protein n=1 Tax=Aspergillus pseudotamarii TaxID=132259 RepID=A0A5N6SBA0_ASPPS|nr:uncharacterized protein BDV38DRAFT_262515 [Aspergillus pseudotamarii]KAE8131992.1 hypothetical protein BDV38DRAFT_262515 [Aspergillus pseudotamarii]
MEHSGLWYTHFRLVDANSVPHILIQPPCPKLYSTHPMLWKIFAIPLGMPCLSIHWILDIWHSRYLRR